ncbi:hypothetical protein CEXT_52041 [Caerostris extrusa]|uniref:Uncharacterized protein n=1 Tax=Caerostris extrusa TaxID=172846 RepID=A0AAV4PS57_CAEEX|nr:hypothetical protein CEXT_52041 [Caerostris extrusa]
MDITWSQNIRKWPRDSAGSWCRNRPCPSGEPAGAEAAQGGDPAPSSNEMLIVEELGLKACSSKNLHSSAQMNCGQKGKQQKKLVKNPKQ